MLALVLRFFTLQGKICLSIWYSILFGCLLDKCAIFSRDNYVRNGKYHSTYSKIWEIHFKTRAFTVFHFRIIKQRVFFKSFILPWPMVRVKIQFISFIQKFTCSSSARRLAFDWKTPFEYLIAFAAGSATSHSSVYSLTATLCFAVGFARLIICLVDEISNDLLQLKAIGIDSKAVNKLPFELIEQFCYSTRFSSDARHLRYFY